MIFVISILNIFTDGGQSSPNLTTSSGAARFFFNIFLSPWLNSFLSQLHLGNHFFFLSSLLRWYLSFFSHPMAGFWQNFFRSTRGFFLWYDRVINDNAYVLLLMWLICNFFSRLAFLGGFFSQVLLWFFFSMLLFSFFSCFLLCNLFFCKFLRSFFFFLAASAALCFSVASAVAFRRASSIALASCSSFLRAYSALIAAISTTTLLYLVTVSSASW